MSEAKVKGSNKLIVILLILTLLIVFSFAGFFGYLFFFKKTDKPTKKASTEKSFQLDEFVTNLADEGTTYVKLTIVLGYEEKALEKEFPSKIPAIRDTINAILWSKTSIDFSGDGKDKIKKEMINSINTKLDSGKITNIYLNEIIIQ